MTNDIDERTRLESDLGKCQCESCRRIANNLFELVCELTEDFRYAFVSPGYKQALGYSADDLLGKSVLEFIHPEEVEAMREVVLRGVSSEGPFGSSSRFLDRDGNWHMYDWNAEVIITGDGEKRLLMCCLGVDERIESQKRLRDLVALAPDALIMSDADGRITLSNPQAEVLFGYSSQELLNKPVEFLIPQRYHRRHPKLRAEFFHDRRNRRMASDSDLMGLRKDGTEFPIEISLSSVGGEAAPYVVASVRDISARIRLEDERKKAAAQVQNTQKLESLGTLAGGIAHDLNNMLAAVMNFSNIALQRVGGIEPAERAIEESKRVMVRMAALCNQLMEYAGKGGSNLVAMDVSDAVEKMRSLLDSSISKKVELRFQLARNLPSVRADNSQITQVVLNLVVNASESLAGAGGTIHVRTGMLVPDEALRSELHLIDSLPGAPGVYLEISDTSCGMDAEMRDRLFDPFYSTKAEGRGMGMAVVLGIVSGHGAAIGVRSQPGKGTRVTVLFPPMTGSEGASAAMPATAATGPDTRGPTILFVEDEGTVRDSARLLLQEAGYDVLVAWDGLEAMRLFAARSEEISLVLLDLAMPGLGGEDVSREFRRVRPDICIVLMSGSTEQVALERYGDPKPTGFIQKPYEAAVLLETIDAAISTTASASPRAPSES